MTGCEHTPRPHRVCTHLRTAPEDAAYRMRFTGHGTEHARVCPDCATADPSAFVDVCDACLPPSSAWAGILGEPGITARASTLHFVHAPVAATVPPFVELAPILGADRARWIGLTRESALIRWDLGDGSLVQLARLPAEAIDVTQPLTMQLSRDASLLALGNLRAPRAFVVDLSSGAVLRTLDRDDETHAEHSDVSLAFIERDGRALLVHASAWNRLDVLDPRTGEILTAREHVRGGDGGSGRAAHDLDYFHAGLAVSPDQRTIVDNGWVWHPVGVVVSWSLERWLAENPWESEDGASRRELCMRTYHWDGPLCWLDDRRVAVYGFGGDDEWLVPAARIFDTTTGEELRWFAGPLGTFTFDGYLITTDATGGTSVWDVEDGARILHDPTLRRARYHPSAKVFVGERVGGRDELVVSRLSGHDVAAAWADDAVRAIARTISAEGTFHELPILGDALDRAGCPSIAMVDHCHAPGEHGDGCWVLDRLRER